MAIKNVDEYIEKHPKWATQLISLREMLLSTGLKETIKWGAPAYTDHDKNIVGLGAWKNHYGLWFFQGALLKENTALLANAQENKTKAMRQLRLTEKDELKPELIRNYILEAVQNSREGKEIKADRSEKKLEIPLLLEKELARDKDLKSSYERLSPGKQREYANHIAEAKREATRLSRLEKAVPLIKEGKGLYDRYKR